MRVCVCDQRQIDDSITAHAHKQKPAAGCVNCVFVCVPKQQQTEHFSICFLCCCCFFRFFFFNFLLLRSTNTTTHSLTRGTMKTFSQHFFGAHSLSFLHFTLLFPRPPYLFSHCTQARLGFCLHEQKNTQHSHTDRITHTRAKRSQQLLQMAKSCCPLLCKLRIWRGKDERVTVTQ